MRKKKSIKRRTKKNESSFKVLTIALLILPLIFCMTITYAVIQENSVLKEQLGEANKANIDLYRVLENCECLCNF